MSKTLKITSRSNDRLTHIRKIRDGRVPDSIFIEGVRLAEEAIRSDVEFEEGVFTPALANTERGSRLLEGLGKRAAVLMEVSDDIFKTISDTTHAQGVAAIARRPDNSRDRFSSRIAGRPQLLLYFHEINDPSNVGAIFRTAEAAGVAGVVLSKGSADAFSPKALRAAMGANLRIPVWERAETVDAIEWARGRGIRVVAADVKGKIGYAGIDWTVPSLLIFGSEAHGLDDGMLARADETVFIPMKNGVESLNLAVSAGIILFEAVRQNS